MEVEIRTKIANLKKTTKDLEALGAKYRGQISLEDKYFGSIELYKKLGYSFLTRIRKSNDNYFLAVKTAKLNIDGCWEEYEDKINNPDFFSKCFKAMGLEEIITVKKTRDEYKLDKLNILIDKFKTYGNFLEVEIEGGSADKAVLFDFLDKMGVEKKNILEKGYITMFLRELNSPFSKYIKN